MKKLIIISLVVMLSGLAFAANTNTITVKGSDTMVRLGQVWAEQYMKAHPEIVIQV